MSCNNCGHAIDISGGDYCTTCNGLISSAREVADTQAKELEDLKAKLSKAMELIALLGLDHDVDTSTKQRSDYWANQFIIFRDKARQTMTELGEE